MNLYFSYTQQLGELEESGHMHRSFPMLVVVGLDLEGCKAQCWAAGLILGDGLGVHTSPWGGQELNFSHGNRVVTSCGVSFLQAASWSL